MDFGFLPSGLIDFCYINFGIMGFGFMRSDFLGFKSFGQIYFGLIGFGITSSLYIRALPWFLGVCVLSLLVVGFRLIGSGFMAFALVNF